MILTEAQIELLQRLIRADRWWHTKKEKGEYESLDMRGIEVNWQITGVRQNTARALVEAGLAEMVNIRSGQNYIFLGKYLPYDDDTSS